MRMLSSFNSRILSQFDHLAETYFGRSEHDLSERELDLALSVDHDLDTVISAIAFTKTELSNAAKDDGKRLGPAYLI
jgi:dynactin 1